MFLIVRADGKFWDGFGWGTKSKPFVSIGSATRSLHEEGENESFVSIVPAEEFFLEETKIPA